MPSRLPLGTLTPAIGDLHENRGERTQHGSGGGCSVDRLDGGGAVTATHPFP